MIERKGETEAKEVSSRIFYPGIALASCTYSSCHIIQTLNASFWIERERTHETSTSYAITIES